MADKMTKEQRHKCMASIHSKNTKPELIVRKYLFAHGFRYRINVKKLPGKPDIVLKKYQTVIFVNGCFWHGHNCNNYIMPQTNIDFWRSKIEKNKQRDMDERIKLRKMGWHVIQIWECQLKPKVRQKNLEGLIYTLNKMILLKYHAKNYKPNENDLIYNVAENNNYYQ